MLYFDPYIVGLVTAAGAAFSSIVAYKATREIGFSSLNAETILPEELLRKQEKKDKSVFERSSGVLSVFPDGTIRTRDGGFIRAYRLSGSETLYANENDVSSLYDSLASTLTTDIPKGSVFQFRFQSDTDPGNLINERALSLLSSETTNPTAFMLEQESLEYLSGLAAEKNFRQGQFSLWIYIPADTKKKKSLKLRPENIAELLLKPREVITRNIENEKSAFEAAKREFRKIELSMPLDPARLGFEEVTVALRLGHNPAALSIPEPPTSPLIDWDSYLCRSAISHNPGEEFVVHDNTPHMVVSLFEPPESSHESQSVYPGLMRFITGNPLLKGATTVITEFITEDKDESVARVKKDLKKLKFTNKSAKTGQTEFKDEKTQRAYTEKAQMVRELSSPGRALVNMRHRIVIKGEKFVFADDRKRIIKELEDRSAKIIELINRFMNGAQAGIEDPAALPSIYDSTLPGNLSSKEQHREIQEQASSLSSFIPAESQWRGTRNPPHNIFVNTAGELTGINLFRNEFSSSPLTLILGVSGSGKSVFAAEIIVGVLSGIPNSRVRACDYGSSLAPLVRLFGGRHLHFNPKDPKTINIWAYDALERQELPGDEQIDLVVKDTLLLLGESETTENGKDFTAILQNAVLQVYRDEVPRNRPGRRHEPRLAHLIRKLRSFPFQTQAEIALANKIAARLEHFEGNPWVDAPTHESYRNVSSFDVFELSSLDRLPENLRSCLAFRIGAHVSNNDEDAAGLNPETLVVYDEVHEYVHNEYLRHALRAAEKITRHGRKKNKVPILISHSFDDIRDFPGFTSNIGNLFIGKQDEIESLKKHRKFPKPLEKAVMNLANLAGSGHQFLYNTGQGASQKSVVLQVLLSPVSLWTFTTNPNEDRARKILSSHFPHWSWAEILIWLATNYPRGLAFHGKTEIDPALIEAAKLREPAVSSQATIQHEIEDPFSEDFDRNLLLEHIEDLVVSELDNIKKQTFSDLKSDFPIIDGIPIEIPGVVIAEIKDSTKEAPYDN